MYISLTGAKSHKVNIPEGQGSLSIGTKGISKGKYDVWVEKESLINWDAFNEFYTPFGKRNSEQFPFGDWPRFFYYSGDDIGFVDWSSKRSVEDFKWSPHENHSIDFSNSKISELFIHIEKSNIEISTGDKIRLLSLSGNLENITIKKCAIMPDLDFSSFVTQEEAHSHLLPLYKTLENATSVSINNDPIGRPFDCKSLMQFRNLENLNLTGNVITLEILTELKYLERIGLRFVPNLTNMPKLRNWSNLKSFIGWNIEETEGKVLKAELNQLLREKEMDYSSVSKLRKAVWFSTEYGIPFSGWENKNAKIALKAYRYCLKEIKQSKTENEVQKAIICFIETINELENIETTEREDVGIAVRQLIESSAIKISKETGQKWFDTIRDF